MCHISVYITEKLLTPLIILYQMHFVAIFLIVMFYYIILFNLILSQIYFTLHFFYFSICFHLVSLHRDSSDNETKIRVTHEKWATRCFPLSSISVENIFRFVVWLYTHKLTSDTHTKWQKTKNVGACVCLYSWNIQNWPFSLYSHAHRFYLNRILSFLWYGD